MEELKYFEVLIISRGVKNWNGETGMRIGAASVMMCTMDQKAKLLIYWSTGVLTLIYRH